MLKENVVTVSVRGKRFTGWESLSISRSLGAVCGAFEMTLSDRLTGEDFSLLTQAEAEVRIDSDLVLSGFIDSVEFSIDGKAHTATLRGRDRTCDLVDCAVPLPLPSAPKGADVFSFFRRIASPFMTVKLITDLLPNKSTEVLKAGEGESPAEVIIRLCKDRGWLPVTTEKGELLITESGSTRATDGLVYGKNILSAKASYDYTNRFSKYTLTGQRGGADAELAETFGGSLSVSASAEDAGVKRYRPMVIHADSAATPGTLKKRAQVEALFRAGNSEGVEVLVQGWRQRSGALWKLNLVVSCKIPPAYVDQDLLIGEVHYLLSESGTVCRMRLKRPDAFHFSNAKAKVKVQKKVGFDAFTG